MEDNQATKEQLVQAKRKLITVIITNHQIKTKWVSHLLWVAPMLDPIKIKQPQILQWVIEMVGLAIHQE